MNYIELSMQNLQAECSEWANEIKKSYQPDIIVYIARGGIIIGQTIQKVVGGQLIGVDAVREGNRLKEVFAPVMPYLPKGLLNFARKAEIKAGIHNQHQERSVKFHPCVERTDCQAPHKILIVDDAVDTGYTLKLVRDMVCKHFPNSMIKTAALTISDESESVIRCDYYRYRNAILRTPMSKDSEEYKDFINYLMNM